MKICRTVACVAALLGSVVACGQAQNTPVSPASPAVEDAPTAQSPLEQQIIAKERAGLDALKTGNTEGFGALTAEDAIFVDDHGAATKAQVMKNVGGFQLTDYSMSDLRFSRLTSKSGLISYTISEQGVSHGHQFSVKAYISSIWAKRDGRWLCVFSQETAARKPPVATQ